MKRMNIGRMAMLAATLVACTQAGGEGQQVDGKGGVVKKEGVSIDIPAGALSGPVAVEIAKRESSGLPAATAPGIQGTAELSADIFVFTPHGTTFAKPVTVQIPHTGKGNVVLRLDDEKDTTWELVPRTTFAGGVVRFEVTRFSIYGVATAEVTEPECSTDAECPVPDPTCIDSTHFTFIGATICDAGRCNSAAGTGTCEEGTHCEGAGKCVDGPPPMPGDECTADANCPGSAAKCLDATHWQSGTKHGVCENGYCVGGDVLTKECKDGQGNVTQCIDGACTDTVCMPYATCEAAFAVHGSCNPNPSDGCGGTMNCAGEVEACTGGQECMQFIDWDGSTKDLYKCETPCTKEGQFSDECTYYPTVCVDSTHIAGGGYDLCRNGRCGGATSASLECSQYFEGTTKCVEGDGEAECVP